MNSAQHLSGIDQVIWQMDQIIERCIIEKSKLGYFATLYRNVTVEVRTRIKSGYFEDGPRMEKLVLVFAQRYLNAIQQYWNNQNPSHSWFVAFKAASTPSPIILQHLILGMNAHINLDLSIATAQVAPGSSLSKIKNDFNKIMNLLSEMIDEVESRLEDVSPAFKALDQIGGKWDEKFAGFAIDKARNMAWLTAEKLCNKSGAELQAAIKVQDEVVALLGKAILTRQLPVKAVLKMIQLKENKDVPAVMKVLKMN